MLRTFLQGVPLVPCFDGTCQISLLTEQKSQDEESTKGSSNGVEHKDDSPSDNISPYKQMSADVTHTMAVNYKPRYLAARSFCEIYVVGNSQTRKPLWSLISPQLPCDMLPTEVKRQRDEVIVLGIPA
jgi:hypothetical protein